MITRTCVRVARRQPDDGRRRRTLCFCSDLLRNELCPVEPSSSSTTASPCSLSKPRWPAKSCFGLGFSALIPTPLRTLSGETMVHDQASPRSLPPIYRQGADIIRISRRSVPERSCWLRQVVYHRGHVLTTPDARSFPSTQLLPLSPLPPLFSPSLFHLALLPKFILTMGKPVA